MKKKLSVKKSLAYRRIAGELFVVDADKAVLHELNGPAALIWEGLAAEKNLEQISSSLAAEFEVDAATAAADAAAFIAGLSKAGLLKGGD